MGNVVPFRRASLFPGKYSDEEISQLIESFDRVIGDRASLVEEMWLEAAHLRLGTFYCVVAVLVPSSRAFAISAGDAFEIVARYPSHEIGWDVTRLAAQHFNVNPVDCTMPTNGEGAA